MIAPQVHTAQPGIIGAQHGLQRLTETLEALRTGQTQQQARDAAMQAQLTAQATALTSLRPWCRRVEVGLAVLGLTLLALCGLVGWQIRHPPEQAYVRALGSLDAVIAQQWGSLPKGTQEAFTSAYGRVGLTPPSQRSK